MARVNPIAVVSMSVAAITIVAAVVLGIRWSQHGDGVEVRLHNVDTAPLQALTVTVTGHTYPLGDLAPGATTSVTVKPTSESSIGVTFATAKSLQVYQQIEPGYSGWISADLTSTDVRHLDDHVEIH